MLRLQQRRSARCILSCRGGRPGELVTALLEYVYIGYSFYELDKHSVLDVMDHVGRGALIEAYQRHEIARNIRSLLFCVLALPVLDALDQGEPLLI